MKRRSNSAGQYTFAQAPTVGVPRSSFDRSHTHKTTLDASKVYPVYIDEVLPGDTHQVSAYIFARLATPLTPFMDTLKADLHFFFVPNRIVQTNFPKVMGAKLPQDGATYVTPKMTAPPGGFEELSLMDYMGLPTKVENLTVLSYPFRAYNAIISQWYCSQPTGQTPILTLDDGPDDPADYVLWTRNKQHDYFTSALPSAQSGDPVELPVGGLATVQSTGDGNPLFNTPGTSDAKLQFDSGSFQMLTLEGASDTGADVTWSDPKLVADLSSATAVTINAMRNAFQTQRFLEKEARGGLRFQEILQAQFGVWPSDARVNRPELLGVGHAYVNVTPVPQTSETTGTSNTPQGNLAGFGIASDRSGGFIKSFEEHGYILGLLSIRANLSYQEGVHKSWLRNERLDYFWPVFSHIGEVPILNQEIQARGVPGTSPDQDSGIWAYQEAWAEYRYKPSLITGRFRSNATNTLEYWHLSEYFGATFPSYNASFLEDKSPVQRVIAVQDEPQFICDLAFKVRSTRAMPTYSVPGYIDQF